MHIRPWEIGLLTVEQLDRCAGQIDRYLAAMNKKGGDDE